MIRKSVFGSVISLVLFSCGSAPSKVAVNPIVKFESFSPPKNAELEVNIGDPIFVEGQNARYKGLQLIDPIKSTMPGAYGVPFSFQISPSILVLEFKRGEFDYYCAPHDKSTAYFPGLGTVVNPNDCIGIRENRLNNELEWTVDNSYHNNMNTVWHKKLTEEDGVRIEPTSVMAADENMKLTQIIFDGYYSNLLHFTLEERKGGTINRREFKFDYPPSQGRPIYGIKGYQFEVTSVSNSSMHYLWTD